MRRFDFRGREILEIRDRGVTESICKRERIIREIWRKIELRLTEEIER